MTETIEHPLLRVQDVSLKFGNVVALSEVSFDVAAGERLGIIGPNGAGKTSLLNCLNGIVRPQQGMVELDGVQLLGRRRHEYVALGVGRTFQGVSLQGDATVADNVLLGCGYLMKATLLESAFGLGRARSEAKRFGQRVEEILEFLQLTPYRNTPAGSLPWGRQKIVEIGRALACEPKLLLLDEPTSGMSHSEKAQVAECIVRLSSDRRLTQILIEHDASFVSELCDRVVVLDYGRIIAVGGPSAVMSNPQVVEAYLGVAAPGTEPTGATGELHGLGSQEGP